MAWPYCLSYRKNCSCVVLLVLFLILSFDICLGFGTFGFDIHHRFSDPVKGILAVDGLPEKGSIEYYVAMAHRDKTIRGRHLASHEDRTPLTFASGNETYKLSSLGFLHYANVSVGTPSLWFLVALDTGSDLFWLPCNCTSCVQALKTGDGQKIDLNIYGPEESSSSKKVQCNSSLCESRRCSSDSSTCPYQVRYLSNGTSSTGFLVDDVLHLTPDDNQSKVIKARITFGCGQVQTGSFLDGAAPNGLFGLGMQNISVPSVLANEGLTSNSFSMCFAFDGTGRITFGDDDSSDHGRTPFNLRVSHPTYNVSIIQISMGGNDDDLEFTAIFDSGTSFTYLNNPAYTYITHGFDSMVEEKRSSPDPDLPFEYCYELSANQTSFSIPMVNLTMAGGDQYDVIDPIIQFYDQDSTRYFCLGIVKSNDVNIIGQNFMTGYRIVFDRENRMLRWKESNCDDDFSNTMPINPSNSPAVSPALAVNPESTSNPSGNSKASPPYQSSKLSSLTLVFIITLVSLFSIF